MANVVVVGLQWGDEGKGKVVDLYTEFADSVVRYGGGANAGHTLVVEGQKVITHLVPSGILRGTHKTYVLADGMVIDPEVLLKEINLFKDLGLIDAHNLFVGQRAHVIMPYHRQLDGLREGGQSKIGTTRRGIGPAYESKMARHGIHMTDLLDASRLKEKILGQLQDVSPLIKHLGGELPNVDEIVTQYTQYGLELAPYIREVSQLVYSHIQKKQRILFEGAQGALLDIDHGTYPYVTSSNTVAAAACTSCGIGPTVISQVVGITKAYTTRVGEGPFPTELMDSQGDALRERGGEYGSTTGRPRRCGWLDAAALRPAVRWNGVSGFALTKLDVLSGLEHVKIGIGYKLPNGEFLQELPLVSTDVPQLEPVYEELPGWQEDITQIRHIEQLPENALRYIKRVEELVGAPCSLVSVGPNRAETILLQNPFA